MSNGGAKVHYATFVDDETGRATRLFHSTHEAVDAEIDCRIRQRPETRAANEALRTRWHAILG